MPPGGVLLQFSSAEFRSGGDNELRLTFTCAANIFNLPSCGFGKRETASTMQSRRPQQEEEASSLHAFPEFLPLAVRECERTQVIELTGRGEGRVEEGGGKPARRACLPACLPGGRVVGRPAG